MQHYVHYVLRSSAKAQILHISISCACALVLHRAGPGPLKTWG